ncbi:unnamed protein product [Prorocentrum cordatum]|uniref:Uncharacterized protein n=1 Tax=Prorocentrum cordatum TaxID=2364126 RepID=A0ABN9RA06_9DINO|nr:unnamed protein product [Polarella glacialis]
MTIPQPEDIQSHRTRNGGAGAALLATDECTGCAFTIDLSCPHHFEKRSGYYHRLADCLLPSYGLLDMARKAKGTVCILTYSLRPNMMPFLEALIPDMLEKGARFIDYAKPCADSLIAHAVDPNVTDQVEKYYMNEFPRLKNITGRYPIDWAANVRAMHRDVAKVVPSPDKAQLVLLDRQNSASRVMYPPAHTALKNILKDIAGAEKTVTDTLRIFTNAVGTIGYHGAAFVNSLFTTVPSCVMEFTTYLNDASTKEWRTNQALAIENRFLSWHKLHINLSTLLTVNGLKAPWFQDKRRDKWIKHFHFVNLLDSDLAALDGDLRACLKDLLEARRWYERSADQGNPDGQYNLALVFAQGLGGCHKDAARARELCEQAAAQGQRQAEALLRSLQAHGAEAAATDGRGAPGDGDDAAGAARGPGGLARPEPDAPGGAACGGAEGAPRAVRFGAEEPLEVGAGRGRWRGTEAQALFPKPGGAGGGLRRLRRLRGLAAEAEVAGILREAQTSLPFGTDGDAVDGWPTYECCVVQAGQYVHAVLEPILRPIIEDRLLPYVRERFGAPNAAVCTVLVRRYLPDERRSRPARAESRFFCSAELGLNVGEFTGGLYVQPRPGAEGREFVELGRGDLAVLGAKKPRRRDRDGHGEDGD